MRNIFLWFYCLPIYEVVLLIILASAVFMFLRKHHEKTVYWEISLRLLFLFWIAVIFLGTLGQRSEGSNFTKPVLIPFVSYHAALQTGNQELYRTNIMNAILFYPAGLLGCGMLPKQWTWGRMAILVTAVFALVSIGIEYTQFHFGLGVAETDDVIHNTLGALLGSVVCSIRRRNK